MATAENLIPDDLGFERESGETLELGQVYKDGRVVSLRRIPRESKAAPPLKDAGARVAVMEDRLVVSEVVEVTPWDDYRADELTIRAKMNEFLAQAKAQLFSESS